MKLKEKIDTYFQLISKIHAEFGYVENWACIPLADNRNMFWEEDGKEVRYFEQPLTEEILDSGAYYAAEIYKQRFLKKWVYRTDDFTMICDSSTPICSIFTANRTISEPC